MGILSRPKIVLVLVALAITCQAAFAGEVNSVTIRGQKVMVGDTADQVFSLLRQADLISQDVGKDPKNPSSLVLTKYYKVEGRTFTVSFARVVDPGPYLVTKIVINEPRTESNKTKLP